MAEERDHMKMFHGALRSLPKFAGTGNQKWRDHEIQYKVWYQTNSIAIVMDNNINQQKMALLSSLTGPATRAVELHGPGKPSFIAAQTHDAYLEVIRAVFLPRAESNLSRMDFEGYKQGVDQPISEYVTTKLSLYHSAEPNENMRSYTYLRNQMLRGICSGYVKNEVIRIDPQNEQAIIEAMITAMGQAREAYQLGVGVVPNLDGLASTTRMTTTGANRAGAFGGNHLPDGAEPMEIGAMTDKKCFKCQKPGHFSRNCPNQRSRGGNQKPRGGSREKFKNSKDITCYYCNKKGHKKPDCFKWKKDQGTQKGNKGQHKGVRKAQDEGEEEEDWDVEDVVNAMTGNWADFQKVAAAKRPSASCRRM